jgi:hypothetical protein
MASLRSLRSITQKQRLDAQITICDRREYSRSCPAFNYCCTVLCRLRFKDAVISEISLIFQLAYRLILAVNVGAAAKGP